MSKSLPGLPQPQGATRLSAPDAVIAGAYATAIQLGISEREIALASMKLAVSLAEKQGDPDGWLAAIMNATKQKETK